MQVAGSVQTGNQSPIQAVLSAALGTLGVLHQQGNSQCEAIDHSSARAETRRTGNLFCVLPQANRSFHRPFRSYPKFGKQTTDRYCKCIMPFGVPNPTFRANFRN